MFYDRRLLFHGFLLFLLGMGSGLVAYQLQNPRMGVSAHLEAILNGVFLIGLGLAWSRLALGGRALAVCFWAALLGAYSNWAIPLFSAGVGASQPILIGAGYEAAAWQESLLAWSALVSVPAPIVCAGVALWGLRRPADAA